MGPLTQTSQAQITSKVSQPTSNSSPIFTSTQITPKMANPNVNIQTQATIATPSSQVMPTSSPNSSLSTASNISSNNP